MKKKKISKRLEKAIKKKQMCKINLVYDPEEVCRFLPLKMSENLVLMIKDGDPALHGYSLRCLDALEKVKLEEEEVKTAVKEDREDVDITKLDITDWGSVFASLEKWNQVVVVESEKLKKKDGNYAIGKIEKSGRKRVLIQYYGPDSAWADKKWKIAYEDITRVTIGSRYTEVLSGYLTESADDSAAQPAE